MLAVLSATTQHSEGGGGPLKWAIARSHLPNNIPPTNHTKIIQNLLLSFVVLSKHIVAILIATCLWDGWFSPDFCCSWKILQAVVFAQARHILEPIVDTFIHFHSRL